MLLNVCQAEILEFLNSRKSFIDRYLESALAS